MTNSEFRSSIKWWEKKRLIYNIFTLLGGLICVFLRSGVPNGVSSYQNFLIIFFWLFGANIFYTFGWSFEFLLNHYFKTNFWNNNVRKLIFILGTIFSFLWMFILTSQV
mgnify:CR=1 FL=1